MTPFSALPLSELGKVIMKLDFKTPLFLFAHPNAVGSVQYLIAHVVILGAKWTLKIWP